MTTTVRSLFEEVGLDLMDPAFTRWTLAELRNYYNEALRVVVSARRDAATVRTTIALTAGTSQSLPAGATGLVDIPQNAAGKQTAVRWLDRGLLDRFEPTWRSSAAVDEVTGYVYDPNDPLRFEVYPPAKDGASVKAVYSTHVGGMDATPANVSSITGDLPLGDEFRAPVRLLMLARAFSRDSEDAANMERAAKAIAEAASTLGVDAAALAAQSPAQRPDTSKRKG